MVSVIYISTVGDTPLAVTNSFWCAVREDSLLVKKVYLLCSGDDEKRNIKGTSRRYEEIKNSILRISKNIGLSLREEDIVLAIVKEENPLEVYEKIEKIYKEHKDAYEICIDITGGRKTMSSGALLFARDKQLKCYYFWLFNPRKCYSKKLDELSEGLDYELVRVHRLWKK